MEPEQQVDHHPLGAVLGVGLEPEPASVAEPDEHAPEPVVPEAVPEPPAPTVLRRSTRACVTKPRPKSKEAKSDDSESEPDTEEYESGHEKSSSRKRKAAPKKKKDGRAAKRRRMLPPAAAAAAPDDGADRLNPWDHRHPAPTFQVADLEQGSVVSMPRIMRVTGVDADDRGFRGDTLRTGSSNNWHVTTNKPIPGMIADQFHRTEKVTRGQLAEIFVKIPTNALDVFTVSFYPVPNEERVAEALEREAKEVGEATSHKEFKAVAKRLLHPDPVTVIGQMKKSGQALGSSLVDQFKDGDLDDKEKINWVTVYHDRLISLILRGVKYELK